MRAQMSEFFTVRSCCPAKVTASLLSSMGLKALKWFLHEVRLPILKSFNNLNLSKIPSKLLFQRLFIIICFQVSLLPSALALSEETNSLGQTPILSNEDFTFAYNGSFIQIDAGRDWPFNSKREISFRFRTKSPHGLLIYQTFDHNKLQREEDLYNSDTTILQNHPTVKTTSSRLHMSTSVHKSLQPSMARYLTYDPNSDHHRDRIKRSNRVVELQNTRNLDESSHELRLSNDRILLKQHQSSNTITATASEKLVNSLFSASPVGAINGNQASSLSRSQIQTSARDKSSMSPASTNVQGVFVSKDIKAVSRNRFLTNIGSINGKPINTGYESQVNSDPSIASTVLSSSTISSMSASLYELYLKLENGRLKLMYEFGSRLNQTYCGKGLNDDRWHRVELKVDPEINQMILILDQSITVEIALTSQNPQEDDTAKRNDLVFTNSILYLGGLNNNASIVKNVRQRLYLAQFIGCVGQILLKTDQHTEFSLLPVAIDKMTLVKRGCINLCAGHDYCLHNSTCVNHYTHTKCDCFGIDYEDTYCWNGKLTSLTMFGHSTLVYRIYDWRDRHHSSNNRLSMRFRTLAPDSILFFAYGDLSGQQASRNPTPSSSLVSVYQTASILNISSPQASPKPMPFPHQGSNNYLAMSLSNGSLIAEVNFGDQPILMSNILYEKIMNSSLEHSYNSSDQKPLTLSDGQWHNVTFVHTNKQIYLQLDQYSINYTLPNKNNHLYFDPSIYIGGVPNFLLNETRTLIKPFNLRYKYIGCLRSVYFNNHNILLNLKQGSPMADYRDFLGKPHLDTCLKPDTNSLPLTLRSGKSYLTFQFSPNDNIPHLNSQDIIESSKQKESLPHQSRSESYLNNNIKKTTRIQFEYKTSLRTYFLAGGHLRDLSYHDLGGFWTLHARDDCQLYFTVSSGLKDDPEQVLKLEVKNKSCYPDSWYRISITLLSGDKILNITRSQFNANDEETFSLDRTDNGSYSLESSVELLHQVQLGGDLSKFGESVSIPFSGCLRRIIINGFSFDSRDFVTLPSTASLPTGPSPLSQNSTITLPTTSLQHDLISSRMAQGYVTMDLCQLVNPCMNLNPCKNGGICKISELGEPDCDCSKSGYTGRRCQFSIYKRSCQELYLSGQRKNSYYLIDTDRNGPMKPIRVRCNMENGGNLIETSLSHNLPAEYFVRRLTSNDLVLSITYLAFHHMYTHDGFYIHDDDDETARNIQDTVLRSIIDQSSFCKQNFRYECRSAPLDLGNRTWMEVPYPKRHKLISLDGNDTGKCACANTEKKCLISEKNCNCDAGEPIWSDDSFDLTSHDQVGITKIVLLRQDEDGKSDSFAIEPQSRFTLSDLKCYGSRHHGSEHEITFKTSDAYIEVPGWRRGDISFHFRTASNPPAIILYQLATSRNHGYFRLTLMSDTRLLFEFIVNRRPRKLFLVSTHKLNNGEWQQIYIEYDMANLRIVVNDDSAMVDLDPTDHLGTFEGPLFIGGAPSKYLIGDSSKRNGFTGCFRGLRIDNRPIDLISYLSPSMPTVISGCQPSCTENLCQNGGKCIEYWGSYECECSNPIAHSGNNCEINLNTNSITFVTPESHYVQPSNESLPFPAYLTKNILLSIRTYQETALILYASDRYYNFIQLHKNSSSVTLTFNTNSTIVTAQLPIGDEPSFGLSVSNQATIITAPTSNEYKIKPSFSNNTILDISSSSNNSSHHGTQSANNLANQKHIETEGSIKASNTSGSGQPIQIKIERHRLRTTFYVNNNFVIVEKPMIFLTNITQNLWLNPEFELVRPVKSRTNGRIPSRIFLAGVDEHFVTRLPGFTGCIQGFSIDNQLYDFNRAHLLGEFRGDYKIGCKMHCDSYPCKNQGICIENWMEDKIECKCESTSYVGRLCDEDIAAVFNGYSSYFIYDVTDKFMTNNKPFKQAQLIKAHNDSLNDVSSGNTSSKITNDGEVKQTPIQSRSMNNYLELSLAFSSEANQSIFAENESTVQVIAYIVRANSSQHFLLGLTPGGGLLIQEDYGSSMSLSRLIKKPDQSYGDGYRHVFRYLRYNQTIQINVDHQSFLPTMSVISANHAGVHSNRSQIYVGTARLSEKSRADEVDLLDKNYINYAGCISNLVIRLDDLSIEPLSEAFGQNLVTINVNASTKKMTYIEPSNEVNIISAEVKENSIPLSNEEDYTSTSLVKQDKILSTARFLNIVNVAGSQEISDNIETIKARDVEQGNCASFRRHENTNEKRSINEPKNTPLLDPRPVYTDPPRLKIYKNHQGLFQSRHQPSPLKIGTVFYIAITFIIIVTSSTLVYAYILQVRYKSEKFRCETPFFKNVRPRSSQPRL